MQISRHHQLIGLRGRDCGSSGARCLSQILPTRGEPGVCDPCRSPSTSSSVSKLQEIRLLTTRCPRWRNTASSWSSLALSLAQPEMGRQLLVPRVDRKEASQEFLRVSSVWCVRSTSAIDNADAHKHKPTKNETQKPNTPKKKKHEEGRHAELLCDNHPVS